MTPEPPSPPPTDDESPTTRMYAGALDDEMCPACARYAGHEFQRDDPHAPSIPNPACSNPQGCRCRWL